MYKISQFQPCLYALVLTGMVGYGLAAGSMGMWIVGCAGVILNWRLNQTGRFKPLPRIVANLLTLGAMVYVGRQLVSAGSSAVLVIGQFLIVLQLVKLWEQRANRDYGQLLVLSLLLMVAASINTGSLLFGLLFAFYLFLSLYCCLLFHLKLETDAARAAHAVTEPKAGPKDAAVLEYANRQDERHLSRSMRRLTSLMAGVAVVAAVIIFLLFPRGAGQAMLVPLQQLQQQIVLTGFSEEVRFDTVARITQNDEVVGFLEVWQHDGTKPQGQQDVKITSSQLLRGVTLDTYYPNGARGEWKRRGDLDEQALPYQAESPWKLPGIRPVKYWRQKFQIKPTGTRALFARAGAFELAPQHELRLKHGVDGSIQAEDPITSQTDYEVLSSGTLEDTPTGPQAAGYLIDPSIVACAERPDVSGQDDQGQSLALLRRKLPPDKRIGMDKTIADNIQSYLHGPTFAYTLDITDAKTRQDKDPYVWFLSPEGHRGHCEYFAGAMVLMCQSLGMDARMVVGFKCDDYTSLGDGRYIIRQSQAHAWVEVRTENGWMEYDPTSGSDAMDAKKSTVAQWWQSARHFFDFLEYTYAEKVVAYDSDNRESLILSVEGRMTKAVMGTGDQLHEVESWLNDLWDHSRVSHYIEELGGPFAVALLIIAVLTVMTVTARWAWQRVQLRRRAARIGIDSLPSAEQLRLARQLGFYDDLVQLLSRRRLTREPHQTPMEFSGSLLFLPSEAYQTVRRLTALYYRVRYGRADLSPLQQRWLGNTITRLDQMLEVAGD